MYGSNEWLSAQVPGTVHQDLIAHDKLPDPFYGMNEQKIQWVEKEDWLYRTSFVLTEEQLHHEGVYLVFEGLDTYADVFLNGSLLLKADNMFVGYRVPVKSVLRKGENRLVVRFRSPIRELMPQWETPVSSMRLDASADFLVLPCEWNTASWPPAKEPGTFSCFYLQMNLASNVLFPVCRGLRW